METRRRVVLFCDISGFMRLAASLGSRMPAFVQAFYEMVGGALVGLGGRIVKYIGDGVLGVFPDGREPEAVQCALLMRADFTVLLGRHAPGDSAQLEVAISSGEVVEGVYGHESLRLYDLMGEAVAHAAVLNRIPGITISSEVRDAVHAKYRTQQLPALHLKWRTDPLEAWAVQGA